VRDKADKGNEAMNMTSINCPYCGTETGSEYNFCIQCEMQIRCLNPSCTAVLLPNKSKCLKCGLSIIQATQGIPAPVNRFVRDVNSTTKSYSEHTEIHATDEALSQFAPLLMNSAQIGYRSPQIPRPSVPTAPTLPQLSPPQAAQADSVDAIRVPSVQTTDQKLLALRFFEQIDDTLIAKAKDFKGLNKKEQQIRLIVAFTWAYTTIYERAVPSRDHYHQAARKASWHDQNFRNYLAEAQKSYLNDVGSGFKLNLAGDKKAELILAEMQDETVEGSSGQSVSRAGGKRGPMNKEEQQRVDAWVTESVDLGTFDHRSLGSPTNYALFALWLITEKVKTANNAKANEAYNYIKHKFENIPITQKQFTDALSKGNGKNFKKAGAQWFLTPDGQKVIEALVNASAPME
jgi:hypothetical protein